MWRGEQRDDQQKRVGIYSYRRDGERIKRIDGERIKAKMKRRFEKDGGERMY